MFLDLTTGNKKVTFNKQLLYQLAIKHILNLFTNNS